MLRSVASSSTGVAFGSSIRMRTAISRLQPGIRNARRQAAPQRTDRMHQGRPAAAELGTSEAGGSDKRNR